MTDDTSPRVVLSAVNIVTARGILITKDIARQLDELELEDWGDFEPLGRIHLNDYAWTLHLLGTARKTGALVRLRYTTNSFFGPRYDERTGKFLPPVSDGLDELRARLAAEHSRLPLIVLPKVAPPTTPA